MRLIIHAGFPKCGSSSIQHALQDHAAALKRQSIFLFGKDLLLNDRFRLGAPPFWMSAKAFLDPERRNGACAQIRRELERVSRKRPDGIAIVSAELLAAAGAERLLKGIDEAVETTVVFYVRPQFQWIPSAWKQWALTRGRPLRQYVAICLATHTPTFRKSLDAWSSGLPKAKIVVRILPQAVTEAGSPAADFFRLIGARLEPNVLPKTPMNPSLDYSVLHVLNKNPWLFAGKKGNKVFNSLAEILPQQHLATNIKMLSPADERNIAAHFRDENMHILRTFLQLDEKVAARLHAEYFEPDEADRSYSDIDENEIVHRGLGILVETILREREAKRSVLRRPYWKILSRTAKRLPDPR